MLQIGEEVEKLKALKLQLGDENASSGPGAELQEKIKAQGDIVRKLKAEKAEKSVVRIIIFITFWLTYYIICIYIISTDFENWQATTKISYVHLNSMKIDEVQLL